MKIDVKSVVIKLILFVVGVFGRCDAENDIVFNNQKTTSQKIISEAPKTINLINLDTSLNFNIIKDRDSLQLDISKISSKDFSELTVFTQPIFSQFNFDADNRADDSGRSDRYKNSVPAVFRITLKGYSIMEHSNNRTHTWTLNKIKGRALRKPEIMFSLTKRF